MRRNLEWKSNRGDDMSCTWVHIAVVVVALLVVALLVFFVVLWRKNERRKERRRTGEVEGRSGSNTHAPRLDEPLLRVLVAIAALVVTILGWFLVPGFVGCCDLGSTALTIHSVQAVEEENPDADAIAVTTVEVTDAGSRNLGSCGLQILLLVRPTADDQAKWQVSEPITEISDSGDWTGRSRYGPKRSSLRHRLRLLQSHSTAMTRGKHAVTSPTQQSSIRPSSRTSSRSCFRRL